MACFENEPTNNNDEPLVSSLMEKKQEMSSVFQDFPSPVQAVLQQVDPESIHMNPIQDIDVLEGTWSKGPVIVIGDAAHAMSPAMGSGCQSRIRR